jgi:hypothetical protein
MIPWRTCMQWLQLVMHSIITTTKIHVSTQVHLRTKVLTLMVGTSYIVMKWLCHLRVVKLLVCSQLAHGMRKKTLLIAKLHTARIHSTPGRLTTSEDTTQSKTSQKFLTLFSAMETLIHGTQVEYS